MNILGYAKHNKDKDFIDLPFNDVDALILAELAYVNFDLAVGNYDFVPFKDVVIKDAKDFYYGSVDYALNEKLFDILKTSKRYQDVKVGFCRSSIDEKKAKQFFALTFLLPNRIAYVAFRGTDVSILGWKEDLMIAYKDGIPGQEDAVKYIKDISKLFTGKFYIGGHSKGGNLALYSALHMGPRLENRLIKVYSFDGPGFRKDIKLLESFERIKDKVVKYLTSNDMVGVIYNGVPNPKVIFSTGILLGGHGPFRWQINSFTNDFIYTSDRILFSHLNEKALMEWLREMSDEDKKMAVDVLLDVLSECETVYDLLLKAGRIITHGKETFENYSPYQREKAKEIYKRLGQYFLAAYSPRQYLLAKKNQSPSDDEDE